MKLLLTLIATGLAGAVLLPRGAPVPGGVPPSGAAVPTRALPGRSEIVGTVLAASYQVMRTPVAGHVVQQYFSEGQTVKARALLLKLTVGSGPAHRTVFAFAPAAGDLTHVTTSAGQYVAAGAPYARLTSRGAVRVRVASTDAARLQPGDSVRVQQGPVGLVGKVTTLTTLLPDPAGKTVVLVLGRLGWPPGTTVRVVLAALRPFSSPMLSATN
jgi:multidrug efflux pump subunit AcrA (membrane-fusion protein)